MKLKGRKLKCSSTAVLPVVYLDGKDCGPSEFMNVEGREQLGPLSLTNSLAAQANA